METKQPQNYAGGYRHVKLEYFCYSSWVIIPIFGQVVAMVKVSSNNLANIAKTAPRQDKF